MGKISTAKRHWLLTLGGLGLLAVLFQQLGPGAILALFDTMGMGNLLIIILIYLCHECARAMALSRCLPPADRLPLWQLTWVQCLSEAVRVVTHAGPFVAEPARGWLLARQGLQGAHAYAAAVSELIANSTISAFVTILILGAALVTVQLGPQLVLLAHILVWSSLAWVAVVTIGLAGRIYIIGAILRGAGRLPLIGCRLRTDPVQVQRMEDAILDVLRDHPGILFQVVMFEFAAQALLIFDTYWVFRSMELPISVSRTLLVEAFTKMANVIHVVGATEGAYAVVFGWLGMSATVGFTLSLVKRVRGLVVAGLSLALMPWLDRKTRTPAPVRPQPPSPAAEQVDDSSDSACLRHPFGEVSP